MENFILVKIREVDQERVVLLNISQIKAIRKPRHFSQKGYEFIIYTVDDDCYYVIEFMKMLSEEFALSLEELK